MISGLICNKFILNVIIWPALRYLNYSNNLFMNQARMTQLLHKI